MTLKTRLSSTTDALKTALNRRFATMSHIPPAMFFQTSLYILHFGYTVWDFFVFICGLESSGEYIAAPHTGPVREVFDTPVSEKMTTTDFSVRYPLNSLTVLVRTHRTFSISVSFNRNSQGRMRHRNCREIPLRSKNQYTVTVFPLQILQRTSLGSSVYDTYPLVYRGRYILCLVFSTVHGCRTRSHP